MIDRYKYELIKNFDERFDRLWEKAGPQYQIIGDRSSLALNWRLGNCPYRNYQTFALTEKASNEILGYLTYQEIGKNIYIADCFAVDIENNLDSLLSKFILYYRDKCFDTITFYYFGNQKIINKVKEYGFITRPDNRSIIVEIDENCSYLDCVLKANNWHYLDSDNDGDAY